MVHCWVQRGCHTHIYIYIHIDFRREATEFVRKIIAGTFAVRSYDYFRVNPPKREDHMHLDPVELVCAVTERARTFSVLVAGAVHPSKGAPALACGKGCRELRGDLDLTNRAVVVSFTNCSRL